MTTSKTHEEIMQEIHDAREQIAAEFDWDPSAILADAQRRMQECGCETYRGPSPDSPLLRFSAYSPVSPSN